MAERPVADEQLRPIDELRLDSQSAADEHVSMKSVIAAPDSESVPPHDATPNVAESPPVPPPPPLPPPPAHATEIEAGGGGAFFPPVPPKTGTIMAPLPEPPAGTPAPPKPPKVQLRNRAQAMGELRDCSTEFELKKMIAKGGQGEVWEAYQAHLGRTIAVKKARSKASEWSDFFQEAFMSAQLDHPNIVPVYDLGIGGGQTPLLAMKRVVGRSWRSLLDEERRAPDFSLPDFLARHLPILMDVINAVSYAHSKGILHRDLKPSQVMVGNFGEVFLLDWGLAVHMGLTVEGTSSADLIDRRRVSVIETALNPAGTPAYMAPEQAERGTRRLGYHTDVYLLGAILYELVQGLPPHYDETIPKAMDRVRRNQFRPLPAETPSDLAVLIHSCLATDPRDRPRSAREVSVALARYISGSGRKEQSRALTAELKTRESELLTDYEELSEAMRNLAQATQLWPENPELPAVRDRLLCAYVNVAVAKGDFQIGGLQAGRIGDEQLAQRMREKVQWAIEEAEGRIPMPPLWNLPRVLLVLATLLVIIVGVYVTIHGAEQAVRKEIVSKVTSAARNAAGELSAADLLAVKARPEIYTPAFQRVLNQLLAVRRSNEDIRYVYTLAPNFEEGQSHWTVLVDVDPIDMDVNANNQIDPEERGNPPGEAYTDGTTEMKEAFDLGNVTVGELVDPWGSFLSAFAPVVETKTRRPVAILGVDVPSSSIQQKTALFRNLAVVVGAVLAAVATLMWVGFFQSRRSLERVRQLEKLLHKQQGELRSGDLHLG